MATVRELHDGRADGLEPLQPLDPLKINDFEQLLEAMSHTAFSGRSLGEAYGILLEMVRDPDCFVVLTLSGALSVAKMGLLVCRMIEAGMVQAVVSTGALMAHGLTEGLGLAHYKVRPGMNDEELYEKGYNRVYDTLEMESNLNEVEQFVARALTRLDLTRPWASETLCRQIGQILDESTDQPAILAAAYRRQVPVYIPAFTDSELGLDVAIRAMIEARQRGADVDTDPWSHLPTYNPFLDLLSYGKRISQQKRLGILTIGGGVPRNWAQQVGPFCDLMEVRAGIDVGQPRFQYGVRICPEPVHWGGLSGCTYSEGVSWGKFVPPHEGGRFAEVYADATTVWPLLVTAALKALGK